MSTKSNPKKSGDRKRQKRDETDSETRQLYVESQNTIRAATTNGSLRDALTRSLSQQFSAPIEVSQSASTMTGLPAPTAGEPVVNPNVCMPLSAVGRSGSSSAMTSPLFPASNPAGGDWAVNENSNSILEVTNRFMNSVQAKRASRIGQVLQRSESNRCIAERRADLEKRGTAVAGGAASSLTVASAPTALEVELHIDELTTTTAKGDVDALRETHMSSTETSNAVAEDQKTQEPVADIDALLEKIEAGAEGSECADDDAMAEDVELEEDEDDDDDVAPNADGSDSDDEADDEATEKIKRRHAMERLQRSVAQQQQLSTETSKQTSPNQAQSAPLPSLFPPTAGTRTNSLTTPLTPASGPSPTSGTAAAAQFKDAATRRRDIMARRASMMGGGLFKGVSSESAAMVQRTSSFDNSTTGPVLFDAKKIAADEDGEPTESAPSKKPKQKLTLVTKKAG